jgi:geranylgeranyl diphosphate synthase type I
MPELIPIMLPAIEAELQHQVARLDEARTQPFYQMLTYHLGWSGEGAGPEAAGKRLRPLLLLLTTTAAGGHWEGALPAAASIELIHNFSLVHDDVQDNSPLRRGRPTVWKKWGAAQAINVGDALFILAHLALFDLREKFPPDTVFHAGQVIQKVCLALTRGQFLDLSYENRVDLTIDDYWPMIAGKTAALLSASTEVGAILAGASPKAIEAYHDFGHYLGLAFQVQDDILGIWGDEALTGKSAASDLVSGKKSLPVLCGLEKDETFARRWRDGKIKAEEAAALREQLANEGAHQYAQDQADRLTEQALQALQKADPKGEASTALKLLGRKQ